MAHFPPRIARPKALVGITDDTGRFVSVEFPYDVYPEDRDNLTLGRDKRNQSAGNFSLGYLVSIDEKIIPLDELVFIAFGNSVKECTDNLKSAMSGMTQNPDTGMVIARPVEGTIYVALRPIHARAISSADAQTIVASLKT